MKPIKPLRAFALLLAALAGSLSGCDPETPAPANPTEDNDAAEVLNTPATAIPDELVGTWYTADNLTPLTQNWAEGTFQGEIGYREFRTLVLTKDGKDAVEYTTDVFRDSEGKHSYYLYRIVGTLAYKTNPVSLTFHARSGTKRTFSDQYTGYRDAPIVRKDMAAYHVTWSNPQATSYPNNDNFLTAQLINGSAYSVRYRKVAPAGQTPPLPSATPPASGSSVRIGSLYYATVRIGQQEWTTMNYAGPGGMPFPGKPQYGSYFCQADLATIALPAGWRIPTRQDYVQLLQSQGIALNQWDATDGADAATKRKLGQLMAPAGWSKQDGFATNSSGFTARPGDYLVPDVTPRGEGQNCRLWTASVDAAGAGVAFNIRQFPSDTDAAFEPFPVAFRAPHLPIRFVRDI